MPYGTRSGGGGHIIRTFTPDEVANCFYLEMGCNLGGIITQAQQKWPGITAEEISITPEHIQTDCLGYDRYDHLDYTNYLCIEASEDYFDRMKS